MTNFMRGSILLAALLTAGCGGNTVSVSGKVTYQGKPLSYGTVVLIDSASLPKSGTIQPDGTFTVAGVTTGPAKIAVSSPRPPGMDPAKPEGRVGRENAGDDKVPREPPPPADPAVIAGWTAIPDNYGDPALSKLTVEVGNGEPLTIDLK